jgi:hypothetical protein
MAVIQKMNSGCEIKENGDIFSVTVMREENLHNSQ